MSKGGSTQKETPQQKAMAEYAMNQMEDYKKRWLPVQKQLAEDIMKLRAPDSSERMKHSGQAATENEAQFDRAREQVQTGLAAAGAAPSSGKAKMAMAKMDASAAGAKGMGMTASDQAVDEAYTQGLGMLVSAGRGEKASAERGMVDVARMSSRQAASDAQLAAAEAMGRGQMVGQVAGLGLGAAMGGGPQQPGMSIDMSPDITPIVAGNSPYSATSSAIMARR